MNAADPYSPIGVFDSGVGGLSVLRAMLPALPHERVIYLADQAHVPYGARSKRELLGFSHAVARFFMAEGAKLIVLACNTASAAALHDLRKTFAGYLFVGMEPAVKPAVALSESGVIGVLATPSTFQGELFASVVGRFAQNANVLKATCPGLVEEIEAGRANGRAAEGILREALEPMLAKGLDSLVMGCTHYPFSMDTIRGIVGERVRVVDPAPAIARRVQDLLAEADLLHANKTPGQVRYFTTGDAKEMGKRIRELLGVEAVVESVRWQEGTLHIQGA